MVKVLAHIAADEADDGGYRHLCYGLLPGDVCDTQTGSEPDAQS